MQEMLSTFQPSFHEVVGCCVLHLHQRVDHSQLVVLLVIVLRVNPCLQLVEGTLGTDEQRGGELSALKSKEMGKRPSTMVANPRPRKSEVLYEILRHNSQAYLNGLLQTIGLAS